MSLICLEDYEKEARKKLNQTTFQFYKSGAGNELSVQLNQEYFDRFRIIPRVLRDVSNRDLTCELFGDHFSFPLAIAPSAMHKMAHPDGEVATARAAGNCGIPYVMSTVATCSIDEISGKAPETVKWFQLYIYKDRSITENLVKNAERSGFKALVLTVDVPTFGLRRANMRDEFKLDPEFDLPSLTDNSNKLEKVSLKKFVMEMFDASVNWEDVKWLMSITKLPILLKGILTPEDARIALDLGVAGIIVSNHGGRQIDSTPATIEILPEIIKVVNDKIPVLLDGGIRQGTDIFKALALGAKMVLIGRPAVYGLAVNGQKGLEDVINILRNELDIAMCLTGCRTINDISKDMICHESKFAKL